MRRTGNVLWIRNVVNSLSPEAPTTRLAWARRPGRRERGRGKPRAVLYHSSVRSKSGALRLRSCPPHPAGRRPRIALMRPMRAQLPDSHGHASRFQRLCDVPEDSHHKRWGGRVVSRAQAKARTARNGVQDPSGVPRVDVGPEEMTTKV